MTDVDGLSSVKVLNADQHWCGNNVRTLFKKIWPTGKACAQVWICPGRWLGRIAFEWPCVAPHSTFVRRHCRAKCRIKCIWFRFYYQSLCGVFQPSGNTLLQPQHILTTFIVTNTSWCFTSVKRFCSWPPKWSIQNGTCLQLYNTRSDQFIGLVISYHCVLHIALALLDGALPCRVQVLETIRAWLVCTCTVLFDCRSVCTVCLSWWYS